MSETPVTLEFLARQQRQILSEVAMLREMMIPRLERLEIATDSGTRILQAILGEIRDIHAAFHRLAARVRTLEEHE